MSDGERDRFKRRNDHGRYTELYFQKGTDPDDEFEVCVFDDGEVIIDVTILSKSDVRLILEVMQERFNQT